jgi:hypothetical protein
MAEADELAVRIVEAIGQDATYADALAALSVVSKWIDGKISDSPPWHGNDIVEISTRIVDAIGPDVAPVDTVIALQFVTTWLTDEVIAPPDLKPTGRPQT